MLLRTSSRDRIPIPIHNRDNILSRDNIHNKASIRRRRSIPNPIPSRDNIRRRRSTPSIPIRSRYSIPIPNPINSRSRGSTLNHTLTRLTIPNRITHTISSRRT